MADSSTFFFDRRKRPREIREGSRKASIIYLPESRLEGSKVSGAIAEHTCTQPESRNAVSFHFALQ